MATPTILVVEDDIAIREMLRFVLDQNGFEIIEAEDAENAQGLIQSSCPSLILLDWMLPGTSGVEFAHNLKKRKGTRDIPIIMITARGEETDKVKGLESGADDYITKPFSTRELVARIQAILRRVQTKSKSGIKTIGALCIDFQKFISVFVQCFFLCLCGVLVEIITSPKNLQ